MFYKIIRISVVLAGLFCLVLFTGLGLGWFGLNNVLFSFQSLLITVGLFSFYQSRPISTKSALLKGINTFVHFLSIPIAIVAAICVKAEDLAINYWYWVNVIMIVFLAINLITIVLKSNIKSVLKTIILLLAVSFSILIVLQMAGKFNDGKIILYSALAFVLIVVLAISFGTQKKINP